MAPRGRSSFPKDNHGSSSTTTILTNASTSAPHLLTPFNLHTANGGIGHAFGAVFWKYTKVMNMRDLSRDDDYLSHLFVEKLGNSATPLMVHKMDPLRRLPKTEAAEILSIVKKLIHSRPSGTTAVKQGVNDLLALPAVRYFIRDYEQSQINAFATHATRYLELYLPTGSIEIAQTSRYSKYTGKNELCILATRALSPGQVITELKGSMADLSEEEDKELKRTGARNDGGTRRDFSVIHSRQMKKNHLFLGPARFVNHDCDHNCELFRTGRYITFRVIKPIAIGQEITAHYGDGYFGRNNKHCLCGTCERNGRGGYCPEPDLDTGDDSDDDSDSNSYNSSEDEDEDSDDEEDTSSSNTGSADLEKVKQKKKRREERQREREREKMKAKINVNQRSTRRGVYLTLPESDPDRGSSESENESDDEIVEIEDRKEVEKGLLDLNSASPCNAVAISTLMTPELSSVPPSSKPVSTISSLSSSGSVPPPVVIIDYDVVLFEDRDSASPDRIGGSVASTIAALGLPSTLGAGVTSDDTRLSVFSNDTGISTITNTNTTSISESASGSPSRSLFKSVITTRGQKAREASFQSQSQSPSSRFVSVSSSSSPQRSSSLRLIVKPDPATQLLDDLSSLSSPPPSLPATTSTTTTTPILEPPSSSEGATVNLNADGSVRRKRGRPRKYPRPENESTPTKSAKATNKNKSKSNSLSSPVKASEKEKTVDIKEESMAEKRLLRSRPSLPSILSSRVSLRNQNREIETNKSVERGAVRGRNVSGTRFGLGTSSSSSPVRLSSLAVADNNANRSKGKEKEKEKPIPTGPCCKTCLLPLLLLPSEGNLNANGIIGGAGGVGSPGKSNSKKGKTKERDAPEECPRCQRHFIVYGVTWPNRTSNGQALSTPRELTPATSVHKSHHRIHHHHSHKYGSGPGSSDKSHTTHYSSKVLQAQSSISTLASSAMGNSKRRHREESDDHLGDLSKRRKLMHKPDIRKYGKAYAKAKLLGRTTKVQIATTVSAAGSRPRGRPSFKFKPSSQELVEASSYETDEEDQPRDINGRFGRKSVTNGKFGRKKKRSTSVNILEEATAPATKRSRIDESEQDSVRQYKTTSATRSVKRLKNASANETDSKVEDEQQQRPVFGDGQGDDFDDRRDKTFWPALPPMPPIGLGFKRTGLLNMRPNPTVVSRWRSQLSSDSSRSPEGTPNLIDDTDDENETKSDDHPATPDDLGSARLVDVDLIESDDANSVTERGKHTHSDTRRHSLQNPLDIVAFSESEDERDDLDDDETQFRSNKVLPALKKFGLSAKPSPIALSKLKWAPKLKVAESDDEVSPFSGQRGNYYQSGKLPVTQTSSPNSRERSASVRSNADVFTAAHEPLSSPRNLTFDAESPSSSSGEEDIILPGTNGPHLFTLQKTAAFATNGQNVEPKKTNDIVNVSSHSIGYVSDDQCTKFNTSMTSAAVTPKVLAITGRLHSSFLSSPVAPSKLVDAGWESSSDASPEPLIA